MKRLLIATLLITTAAVAGDARDELRRIGPLPKCATIAGEAVCFVWLDLRRGQARVLEFPVDNVDCDRRTTHQLATPDGVIGQLHSGLCTGRVGFYNLTRYRRQGAAMIWLESP